MKRILLVDDDTTILAALSRIVARRGWEPLTAQSGPEALGIVGRVDAVVTDLCMPGMDGLELVGIIRRRDETLPVILVTGQEHLAPQAYRAGAYDYLTKPFDMDRITMALERALEARRLRLENRQLKGERAIARRAVSTRAAHVG